MEGVTTMFVVTTPNCRETKEKLMENEITTEQRQGNSTLFNYTKKVITAR